MRRCWMSRQKAAPAENCPSLLKNGTICKAPVSAIQSSMIAAASDSPLAHLRGIVSGEIGWITDRQLSGDGMA
jgi:hypothetical protein